MCRIEVGVSVAITPDADKVGHPRFFSDWEKAWVAVRHPP
jgi:hypothetical protein